MFLLWISPCAGPHDSFSTDILKGPSLSPPPRLSPSQLSLFPCVKAPAAGLSQPAVPVSHSGNEEPTERRNETHVESPYSQRVGWWRILLLVSLSSPGGQRGRGGAFMGGSTRWQPEGDKHTSNMRGGDHLPLLLLPCHIPTLPRSSLYRSTPLFLTRSLVSMSFLRLSKEDPASFWFTEGFLLGLTVYIMGWLVTHSWTVDWPK